MTFKLSEFAKRRKLLAQHMGKKSVAILPTAPEVMRNRDSDYPFRPDSDFFYLTGFHEPEALAVIIADGKSVNFVLFCRAKDPKMEIWTGARVGLEKGITQYGATEAYAYSDIDEILPSLLENQEKIFYSLGNNEAFDIQLIQWLNEVKQKSRAGITAPSKILTLDNVIHEMRLCKSPSEIKTMRSAAKISSQAHRRAMQTCRPNLYEYEIEAEILHTFRKNNCVPAYNSIVGGGQNACTLHYTSNNTRLNDGELLLIDAGAELDYYASDITRTFPINGKFSLPQKAIYDIVLQAQLAAINQVKPGQTWNAPHQAAVKKLTQGLLDLGLLKGNIKKLIESEAYRKFYMHRTGHWLGMDVHDVGEYKINGKWRRLVPGMVLTVEPGIYIPAGSKGVNKKWWNIGVRIEDDVLVTHQGHEVLSCDTPKTTEDIERLMAAT